MKTDHLIIGAALAFGAYLYFTNKKSIATNTNTGPVMAPVQNRNAAQPTINGFAR